MSSSSSDDDLPKAFRETSAAETSLDVVKKWSFESPFLDGGLTLVQPDVSGSIGFKLYPAALFCCKMLESMMMCRDEGAFLATLGSRQPSSPPISALLATRLPGSVILELGAGISGLPSQLLARMDAIPIATDLPAVLPQLASNIASNAGIGPTKLAPSTSDSGCRGSCDAPKGGPSPVRVWPLIWGDADSGADILSRFAAEFGGRNCDLILAADVIYHEHLIVPLLDTLVLLTEPLSGLFTATGRPPLILISYVQRFKRAKQFVKAARRWFDVTIVSVSSVVDYDALNWNRGASELTVNSSSADWAGFPPLADGSRPVSCLAYHYILMRRAGK